MATQTENSRPGLPLWLPIVGVVIAVLVLTLVVLRNANPTGKVGVTAPAGATPNRMPDEGDVIRAQQAQGKK